jgi:hypothetical protein
MNVHLLFQIMHIGEKKLTNRPTDQPLRFLRSKQNVSMFLLKRLYVYKKMPV